MTPRELFETDSKIHGFVHGSDVGVDKVGHIWVRATARVRQDLKAHVSHLSQRPASSQAREYAAITSGGIIALDARHRSEPLWKYVHELDASSIGAEWIAVN